MKKLATEFINFFYSINIERYVTKIIHLFCYLFSGGSTINYNGRVLVYTSMFPGHRFFIFVKEEDQILEQKLESPTYEESEFYGSRFLVNNRVLRPRKKTEKVVSVAISRLKELLREPNRPIKIIDVGTGSGNIVISIAQRLKHQRIFYFATDISFQAIKVAKLNAARHRVQKRIDYINADLVSCLRFQPDLIVANLPYEPRREKSFASSISEPFEARFDEGNGMQITSRLIRQVINYSLLPSVLILESAPELILKIRDFVLEQAKYPPREINIYSDHKDLPRVIEFLW